MNVLIAAILLTAATTPGPLDRLNVNPRGVSWGPFEIFASHSTVERRLGRRLVITKKPYVEACGSGASRTTFAGSRVRMKWSDDAKHELEAFFVVLPRNSKRSDLVRELAARAGLNAKPCGPAPGDCYEHPAGITLLLTDDREPVELWVVISNCF